MPILRLMTVKRAAGALLVLALTGCASDEAITVSEGATSNAVSADTVCAAAAEQWGGTVAGAFLTTVAEVRAYMDDPHGAAEDPTAPRPGTFVYPAEWDSLDESNSAAACYLDGPVPKGPPPASDGTAQPSFDRRLIIAAEDVTSFMVSAGYKVYVPAEPLSQRRG